MSIRGNSLKKAEFLGNQKIIMTQEIKIIAEPQMEPNKCKFKLENSLVEEGSYYFRSLEDAKGSAIAEEIFKIKGVSAVFVANNSVIVTTSEIPDWQITAKEVGTVIRCTLSSKTPLISEEFKKKIPSADEIRKKVLEILNNEVNPSLASHGGVIELLDVRNNDIFVRMGGGCQGCGMARATLKQGVERALRNAIPYLGSVYDTTDHAAGKNPYYSPG